MRTRTISLIAAATFAVLSVTSRVFAQDKAAPTDAEQVAGIQKMCGDNSVAIQKRQVEKPLYDRLGKRAKIKVLATNIFLAHSKNEKIGHLFTHVKRDPFVKNVTDFLVSGTGGKAEYRGKDMVSAHKDLKITNADFLAAGGDVQAVMKKMKYGENEIQEIVCALTSFVPLVVTQH